MKHVGIVVFDEVEVLDFAGPFEVLAVTEDESKTKLFQVTLLGTQPGPVRARNGLSVVPDRLCSQTLDLDLLVVPGGYGAERLTILDRRFLAWLAAARSRVPLIASVCTGAFLLAEAGLLDGRRATTHHLDFDEFEARWPRVTLVRDRKWVDEGSLVTSGGISSGIDMALHLVARLEGVETARRTAARMEYRWQEQP
jgi:transcriptional regulator GlxA family with amidase domain